MKPFKMPFPNGHNPTFDDGVKIKLKGILLKDMKNEVIRVKADEDDIREIRMIIIEEVKRQSRDNDM